MASGGASVIIGITIGPTLSGLIHDAMLRVVDIVPGLCWIGKTARAADRAKS